MGSITISAITPSPYRNRLIVPPRHKPHPTSAISAFFVPTQGICNVQKENRLILKSVFTDDYQCIDSIFENMNVFVELSG